MKVFCPSCRTGYRLDDAKVPTAGVVARCERCPSRFRIERPVGDPIQERRASVAKEPQQYSTPGATAFGAETPNQKAERLARVLVADIKAYHPDRWERCVAAGTLKQEFREEIRKSWDEYTLQVGGQVAGQTSFFRDALNQILAGGKRVF